MINFCHIAPTPHLDDFCKNNKVDLILAHLVETDPVYAEWYKNHIAFKILDNSAFELYKQNKPMYEPTKLIEMGNRVNANVIVMSDYPNEPAQKTINAAEILGPQFHDAGFQTFFVPQSKIGDMDDYLRAWDYAVQSPNVDFLGMSILGVPHAFGHIEKDNKLQRFMSRWAMMNILKERGVLQAAKENNKKIHFLGALDGWPGEVALMKEFHDDIFSWDSSGAVWLSIHGDKTYDNSPTRQLHGKYEVEVDFNYHTTDEMRIKKAHFNQEILNSILTSK